MILRSAIIREGENGHEAGRNLLEKMYWEVMGEPMPPIAVTERGKPYFAERATAKTPNIRRSTSRLCRIL